ncbi:MAG: hypothetical protein E7E83_01530 [Enterobacter ludwigii]|nr:hypothetical protein [Enterobacter ludwigii]
MKYGMTLSAVIVCLFIARTGQAEDVRGGSVNLDLSLLVEQETCAMTLVTPDSMSFANVRASDLKAPGVIERLAAKTISLNLTGCSGGRIAGQTPAIMVSGNTYNGYPTLFRDDSSTAQGAIGFRIRYQSPQGVPGEPLTDQQYVDLSGAGDVPEDGLQNFLVDMQYGGGEWTTGGIISTFRFTFLYH